MAEREQVNRPAPKQDQAPAEQEAVTGQGDELKAEMDDILDEIDEVLESNAEEFVKSYIQKGGQ